MQNPLLSILINNYNYGRFLPDAIDSALHQSYAPIEVIVVDDGSTDHSRDIMAQYGERIVPIYQENGGQAAAFNSGVATARGDIVCFLDADDLFLPGKAARLADLFARHPGVGSCFHPVQRIGADGTAASAGRRFYPAGVLDFRRDIRRGRMPFIATTTSGLSFHRSLLPSIFPTPENAGLSACDLYIKWTALAIAPTLFLDEPLAQQRIHGANSYTTQAGPYLRAQHRIITSCWMRERFPELERWADKVFADGLAQYHRAGTDTPELGHMISAYLSSLSPGRRRAVQLRSLYHRFRP